MNKNKGFVGIGLIVAIVLGAAVVGGGAYYLGKGGDNKKIEKATEREIISDEYQKLPTVESEKAEISTPTNTKISTECTASSTPSIKVLSPNGGEVYKAGDKINVKWTSCNVEKVYVSMAQGGHDMGNLSESSILASLGSYQWTVPNTQWQSNTGFLFGIWDADPGHLDVVGKSGSFTINFAPTKTISTTDWKTYTNSEYDFSFKYPSEWVRVGEDRRVVNREGLISNIEVQFKDTSTGSDLLVNYSISNGVELYNYALEQFNTSVGWYAENAEKTTISGSIAIKANSIMSVSGKGNPINPPLKLTLVDFMDDNNMGGFNIQFRVPSTNYEKEIVKFNQLLTTFKFTD